MTEHPQHSDEALEKLAAELAAIGPGWSLATGAEGLIRSERAGTLRYEQAALSPRALLQAVQERERQLTSDAAVSIHTGPASS